MISPRRLGARRQRRYEYNCERDNSSYDCTNHNYANHNCSNYNCVNHGCTAVDFGSSKSLAMPGASSGRRKIAGNSRYNVDSGHSTADHHHHRHRQKFPQTGPYSDIYEELKRINEAVRQAQEGTYPGFEASVKILKKHQHDTINVQKFLLNCRVESALQMYRQEEIEISERLEREKEELKGSMLNTIEHSYYKLFESHGVLDTNYSSYLNAARGFPTRSTRSISGKTCPDEKKEKRKRPQGLPSLNLSLSPADIAQDLHDIKKSLENK